MEPVKVFWEMFDTGDIKLYFIDFIMSAAAYGSHHNGGCFVAALVQRQPPAMLGRVKRII